MSADLVMKPVTTVAKETTIRDAARTIVERDIECLLVMDSNRLAGSFSRTDLLRNWPNDKETRRLV
jgi:CBS domain-containing protein